MLHCNKPSSLALALNYVEPNEFRLLEVQNQAPHREQSTSSSVKSMSASLSRTCNRTTCDWKSINSSSSTPVIVAQISSSGFSKIYQTECPTKMNINAKIVTTSTEIYVVWRMPTVHRSICQSALEDAANAHTTASTAPSCFHRALWSFASIQFRSQFLAASR